MATKTRDITPSSKGQEEPQHFSCSHKCHELIASNRKNIYLKSKVSSSHDKTPSTNANIKQTLNDRTSIDKPPSSFDNTQVKKNPTLSNDLNFVLNKPNIARGSLLDNRLSTPSNFDITQGKKLASSSCVPPNIHNKQTQARRRLSFDNSPPQSSSLDYNTQVKKLASSISDSNIQCKQTLARRRLSFDHRPPPPSFRDNSPQSKKLVPKSDTNIHRKQTPTRRRLSIDHKPPLLKNRTSPNPKERILKPPLSSSSKNSTSQKPLLNKLPKAPHTSYKDAVIGKQHGAGLNDKAVNMNKTITKKQDSPTGLTAKEFIITSNLKDPLEQEEFQELVIEDLTETANIDEYLKAAESSPLYVVENQEVINMEVPKDQQLLVEETNNIKDHKELEEIKNLEPSNLDHKEIEKQEEVNQEEKGEESETLLKALDDCQEKKEEGKEVNLNTHQEEKEESERRNNKGKEEKNNNNNNKTSTTTMAFAKAYPHLVHKKESVVLSNDVIEETASKLRDQRKNRVKALASAFETVISLQDPK
ncbi:unnamed protein product [Withania somnifera]